MIPANIITLFKESKLIYLKFLSRAFFPLMSWKLRFLNPTYWFSPLTRVCLLVLIIIILVSCSQKRGVAKNSNQQFYQDVTLGYLPAGKISFQGVTFARADRNPGLDLIGFISEPNKGATIKIFFNEGKNGIGRSAGATRIQRVDESINFLTVGDINGNSMDDLILVTSFNEERPLKILLNNGKGYFFSKPGVKSPLIYRAMERVDPVDLDQDGDVDLIFTGRKVLHTKGERHTRQGQVLINNGAGQFEDMTTLLWPELPPGIVGSSIADYDKDGLPDVFLVYGDGQNRLLMNNGVGQFVDKTDWLLPRVLDQSTHADWADFDLDGDNDLLVTNKTIKKRYQGHSSETCYFLENDGYGRFRKRSGEKLPPSPAFRVYLLDANGTGIPDIIILNDNGPYYMVGQGKWNFSVETKKRLPKTSPMRELKFGDINGDGFLDLVGIVSKNDSPKLWLNRVE